MNTLPPSNHRPWPIPTSPWIMSQAWHDLLFAHWPVSVEILQPFVPEPLQIDTYEGQAWIAVVPFRMSSVRLRGMPALPWLSAFPEMNVRTYVRLNGKPGVFFFSLDATNPIAVAAARSWFHLPYFNARMSLKTNSDEILYNSRRKFCGQQKIAFQATYRPIGDTFRAKPGSLECWLTERYCLYAADASVHIYISEIHHAPWPLQSAQCAIETNTMTLPISVSLTSQPALLHFAKRQDVVVWKPKRIT